MKILKQVGYRDYRGWFLFHRSRRGLGDGI